MKITNVQDLITTLRPYLPAYLNRVTGTDIAANPKKFFNCLVHEGDKTPSMHLDPKRNNEFVHCFSCGAHLDIFALHAAINSLDLKTQDWPLIILPQLCEMFDIPMVYGQMTELDKEKDKLYRMTSVLASILAANPATAYAEERKWSMDHLIIGQCSFDTAFQGLIQNGFERDYIFKSLMLRNGPLEFVGDNSVTFVINDERGRPVGVISRNISGTGQKYINSVESCIYRKSETLFGLDIALKLGKAKNEGVYIVEGPGYLAALHRLGIYNVAAICSTAFGGQHLALLKSLGIKRVFFSLDWDNPGVLATERILFNEVKFAPGLSCFVVEPPENQAKYASEFASNFIDGDYIPYIVLEKTPAF